MRRAPAFWIRLLKTENGARALLGDPDPAIIKTRAEPGEARQAAPGLTAVQDSLLRR